MKHLTTYPIESLSGTDKSEPKRTYYKYKGCQISRTYNPPPPPYNPSLNAGRAFNDASLKAYKLLSHDQCQKWCSFCDSWNLITPSLVKPYNVWTAFCTVNFYRQLTGLSILSEPPSTYGSTLLYSCELKTLPDLPLAGRFDAEVRNFPTSDGYCVFWLTTPYSNFPHAYRKPESRLCSGFSPLSVAYISDTSNPFQFIVDNLSYQILSSQYCYVDTRLITKDGFPMPFRRFNIQTEEAGLITSIGILWHLFTLAGVEGAPFNYQDDTSCDSDKTCLLFNSDSSSCRIPIDLRSGSIIDSFKILFSAEPSSNLQLGIFLSHADFSDTNGIWIIDRSNYPTWNQPNNSPKVFCYYFDPLTLEEGKVYTIIVKYFTGSLPAALYSIGFRSTKRIY